MDFNGSPNGLQGPLKGSPAGAAAAGGDLKERIYSQARGHHAAYLMPIGLQSGEVQSGRIMTNRAKCPIGPIGQAPIGRSAHQSGNWPNRAIGRCPKSEN